MRHLSRNRITTARAAVLVVALLIVGALALRAAGPVDAHARLRSADPAPGSALAVAPDVIRLTFSEEIDPAYSSASLLTATGETVPTGPLGADPGNPRVAIVPLEDPANLPAGAYTLVWRVLSAVDGHITTGTVAFSAGTGQAPSNPGSWETATRPSWARAAASWIELVSLLLVVGAFPFGAVVARPLVRNRRVVEGIARVWWLALTSLILAMLAVLWSQAVQVGDTRLPSAAVLQDVLLDSAFGVWWLVRLVLIGLLVTVALAVIGRPGAMGFSPPGHLWRWWLGGAIGAGALVTLPLAGHAAAADRTALAVAADWIHLAGAAIWFGGLTYLLVLLHGWTRPNEALAMEDAARLARRFSWTALATVLILLVSGFVNGALHVSGPRALTSQDYGITLIAKHLVVAVILIAAAVNLLITVPRLRDATARQLPDAARSLLKALRVTVAGEWIAGLLILIASTLLTELPPADAPLPVDVATKVVTVNARQTAGEFEVWLLGRLTGQASDRLTLTVADRAGQPPASLQRVIVETSAPAPDGDQSPPLGDRFDADPLAGSAATFVFPATRLGLATTWSLDVIVRRAGVEDVAATFAIDTREAGLQPPRLVDDRWRLPRLPAAAWAFLALAAAAAVGGIAGLRLLPGLDPLAGGIMLTMAGLIAAGFAVSAVRQTVPETSATALQNPVPSDPGSLQRGEALYTAQCLACHGASGAGPNDEETDEDDPSHRHGPNADLTSRRAKAQRDGDLFFWMSNGVPGTEMPAYDHALTEAERWDVVNYLRLLQRGAGAEAPADASPAPSP